jgi:endoglucanase
MIGWGFLNYFPGASFGGNVFAVITGRGTPTAAELGVLERYLGTTAGI